jgi:hypothetical protein
MYSMTQKNIQLFMSGSVRQLNFCIQHSKKCETVTKIQDTEVANCGRWLASKGGQLNGILLCVHITPVF